MKVVFLLVVVLLCLSCSNGAKLVYIDVPREQDVTSFVARLVQSGVDVRGDRADYVLAVDTNGVAGYYSHVIFEDYDSTLTSYYVAEVVGPTNSGTVQTLLFDNYRYKTVKNTEIFSVPKEEEQQFVSEIPSYLELVLIPDSALPSPANTEYALPGAPDPVIAQLITQVASNTLKEFVTYLTGEASTIITRQSQSTGAVAAQNYLEQQFTKFGFSVKTQPFRAGYSSNVVATLTGTKNPNQIVMVSGHYDCRGPTLTSTTNRAPGANDNGSGMGALLQIAKIISDNKLKFAYTVVITAFSGEEQGLYGSAFAAKAYYDQKVDIIAVLNADMIAYRAPNANAQLDFTSRSTTPTLHRTLVNITQTYVKGLALGTTTACCTDSASFYDQGYPAISFCEKNGYTVDPMYHKEGDLVNRVGYDIGEQYPLIVQSMLAGLLTIAQLS